MVTTARRRQLTYGIDGTEYKVLFETQDGCCAICGKDKPLVIDHDHQTQKVRGLLCTDCNTSLGKLGDDIAGLTRALDYLKRAGSV